MFKDIILAIIPIFVAVDAIGSMPIFISLTENRTQKEKHHIIAQSLLTASILAGGFVFIGEMVLRYMGITIGDFMIAGGVILFSLAMSDILKPTQKQDIPTSHLGSVPLGTPLIAGPGLLATSLLVIHQHGLIATLIAVIFNILLAGGIFAVSSYMIKILGNAGTKAISKIISLMLAAYAVMLIRRGFEHFLG
ncbi:MAG: MarC family protein [Phycisphaerae bacterium]|nr:MarC family protein [Phycisphaerae bacterium]